MYEDPDDWTSSVTVVRGTPIRLRTGGLIFRDDQPHEFMPLRPHGSASVAPLTHLLGKVMIDGEASRWEDVSFELPLRRHAHQLEWTRYMLIRERDLLRRTGVYSSVFLSLFSYHIDTPWLWAFCERWNYSTNTLFIDDRELTPTLWEMRQLTGLPIFGEYYDEFQIPSDDLRDSPQLPASLRRVYEIYHQVRGRHSTARFDFWISYFTDRVQSTSTDPASLRDPFGTGRPCIYHEGPIPSQDSISSLEIDRETFLTAFIAWWICFFLLPSSPICTVRPSVFVMANRIARGERVSLAVPVLANIYRGLRGLTSSHSPSLCRELVPWHFISGWLHMHWSGLYTPHLDSDLRGDLPILADLAGIQPASMTPVDARFRFYRSREHLRFAHTRLATHHTVRATFRLVTDSRPPSRGIPGIRDRPDDLDYLISIRQGFLPLRVGSYAFVEPYSPHRCAHQFGLDQVVPAPHLLPDTLVIDLDGLGWCYAHLFRMGTGSRCQMVSIVRAPTFSRCYMQWYHSAIFSYQSYQPSTVVSMTCPPARGGSQELRRPVTDDHRPFPTMTIGPPDFSGLDSRFSRSPAMTLLAGKHLFFSYFPFF
jgi:Plant mobile domain